jgi:hypothetical protein
MKARIIQCALLACVIFPAAGCVDVQRYTFPRRPPHEGYLVTVNKGPIMATENTIGVKEADGKSMTTDEKLFVKPAPDKKEGPADLKKADDKSDEGKDKKSPESPEAKKAENKPGEAATLKDAKKESGETKTGDTSSQKLKIGEAKSQGILQAVAWGDSSIKTAAEKAGIKKIISVDYEHVAVALPFWGRLVIYESFTTIVQGE